MTTDLGILFDAAKVQALWDAWVTVRDKFSSILHVETKAIELPRNDVVDLANFVKLIRLCYEASLATEEQRPIRFQVLLLTSEFSRPEGLASIDFQKARQISSRDLIKVAPALNPRRSLIALLLRDFGTATEPNVGLSLEGILHRRDDEGGVLDRHRFQPVIPSPELIVSVIGPGDLLVHCGVFVVARIRKSEMYLAPVQSAFVHEFQDSAFIERFFAPAIADITANDSRDRTGARRRLKTDVAGVFRRLVADVDARRHGGTLLFVRSDGDEALKGLDIKYRFAAADCRLGEHLAEAFEHDADDKYSKPTFAHFLNARHNLSRTINFIGSLSQVDGAVVMNDRLHVLGFGAKIAATDHEVVEMFDIEVGVNRELAWTLPRDVALDTLGGMRHQSAASFCHARRELQAMAAVVSSDGGATFFVAHEKRLGRNRQFETGSYDFWLAGEGLEPKAIKLNQTWYVYRKEDSPPPNPETPTPGFG